MIALVIIAALLLVVFLFHAIMSIKEQKDFPAPGKLVSFDDEQLHIFSMGQKSDTLPTVIILHDCGECAPAVCHFSLMNELSTQYRVVTVERCGHGWSSDTFAQRTAADIVYEYRTVLQHSGEGGMPYILLPFGNALSFASYWQKNFPDEVEKIISVKTHNKAPANSILPSVIGILRECGFLRLYNLFVPVSDEQTGGNTAVYKALANSRTMSIPAREEIKAFVLSEPGKTDDGEVQFDENDTTALTNELFSYTKQVDLCE